jgi:hypothetical protein
MKSNAKNKADITHKTKHGQFPHSVLDGRYGKRECGGDLMYSSIKNTIT